MKKFSVLLAIIMCVFSCFPVFAAEKDLPESRLMCDIDNNGSVTASDARQLLRYAVGLEQFDELTILYADVTKDGTISASDARMALRTAVNLETEEAFYFEVTDVKEATCVETGYIKGRCVVSGTEQSVTIKQTGHTLTDDYCCDGVGVCSVCHQSVLTEVKHSFITDYVEGIRTCLYCGYSEQFVHIHSFNSNTGYCVCGIYIKSAFEDTVKEYLIENGTYENGMYYVAEDAGYATFAACYEENGTEFAYLYCGFGIIEQNGEVYYYEFYFDFEDDTIEMFMGTETEIIAYLYGDINAGLIDVDGFDGVSVIEFDAIPELMPYESDFRIIAEGVIYDSVLWLRALAKEIGFSNPTLVFADYSQVK